MGEGKLRSTGPLPWLEPTFLTQWVSIWYPSGNAQYPIGFALAPLQMLPGIGSAQGRSWDKILRGFNCGWHCFSESFAFSYLLQQLQQQPHQSSVAVALATPMSPHHAILLIGYVGLNSLSDQHDRPLPDEARRRCAQLDQLLAAAADHDHPFLGATAGRVP
jgi:hypothetical protein